MKLNINIPTPNPSEHRHYTEVIYENHGLRIERNGEYLTVRLTNSKTWRQTIVHRDYRNNLQGMIKIKNATLEYWLNEEADTWNFIHGYRTQLDGEFSKEWAYNNIFVPHFGGITVEQGRAPGAENEFRWMLIVCGVAIPLIAVFLWYWLALY